MRVALPRHPVSVPAALASYLPATAIVGMLREERGRMNGGRMGGGRICVRD